MLHRSASLSHRLGGVILVLIVFAFLSKGCATYSDHLRNTRTALAQGEPGQAFTELNTYIQELQEASGDDASDTSLLVLERGTIQLIRGNWKDASRDFVQVDPMFEVLDLRDKTGDSIARFLFSDDAGEYVMPAFEKGLINTLNMLSFMAQGSLSAARVEARRYTINGTFYDGENAGERALNPLGSYLAATVFELSDRPDLSLRYFAEMDPAYYGAFETFIGRVMADAKTIPPALREAIPEFNVNKTASPESEILVVIGSGRVPHKMPVRLPIGLALTIAGHHANTAEGDLLAAQGAVTWVNFSELHPSEATFEAPEVHVGGKEIPLVLLLDVESLALDSFEKKKSLMMGAAITRAVTRAVAGGVASAVLEEQSGWGVLASLLIQGTMVAMDRPDTRSWSTLPGRFWVGRAFLGKDVNSVVLRGRDALGIRRIVETRDVDLSQDVLQIVPMFTH